MYENSGLSVRKLRNTHGVATQLARSATDISEIARVTRHRSLQTARGYVEEEERKTTSALLKLDL